MSATPEDSRAGLEEGMSTLSEAHNELTDLLNDLQSELTPSLDQWENNAHSAYVEAQRSWDVSTAKQGEIVRHMPDLLGNT